MPHDDFESVAYRILRYIDACQKRGVSPSITQARKAVEWASDGYFAIVVKSLIAEGYVTGIDVTTYYDQSVDVFFREPSLTMAGAAFLSDNSGMQKAKEAAGTTFEAFLDASISALVRIAAGM